MSVFRSSVPFPSLRMPVMKNKPYPHKEKPLTQSIAQEIISKQTKTTGSPMTVIAKHVHKKHVELGGLPSEKDLEDIVKSALRYLSQFGEANQIALDTWRIPTLNQQIFGSGKHWIYLYYFNEEKKKANPIAHLLMTMRITFFGHVRLAKLIKIPKTELNPKRVVFEVPPHIGLLLRIDEHYALEKAIHGILTVRGRHLERAPRKRVVSHQPKGSEKYL